jgi:hypothetical protein
MDFVILTSFDKVNWVSIQANGVVLVERDMSKKYSDNNLDVSPVEALNQPLIPRPLMNGKRHAYKQWKNVLTQCVYIKRLVF